MVSPGAIRSRACHTADWNVVPLKQSGKGFFPSYNSPSNDILSKAGCRVDPEIDRAIRARFNIYFK